MRDEIAMCRRIAGRQLGLRLGYYQRMNTVCRATSVDLDSKIKSAFMAGLEDVDKLPEMQMMGALLHPLYQSELRMEDAGLATAGQIQHGVDELLDCLCRYYEKEIEAYY